MKNPSARLLIKATRENAAHQKEKHLRLKNRTDMATPTARPVTANIKREKTERCDSSAWFNDLRAGVTASCLIQCIKLLGTDVNQLK